ncbi:hypothetical protein UM855_01655 [Staphylococcus aureus]|nr:hypothetical protein UM855_01655 [Staphylococcus aureus]
MIRSSSDIQEAKQNKCIQRNNTCKWSSIIRSSPDIQEAKRNKCIQRNNTCKWSSIIWRSPDTKKPSETNAYNVTTHADGTATYGPRVTK